MIACLFVCFHVCLMSCLSFLLSLITECSDWQVRYDERLLDGEACGPTELYRSCAAAGSRDRVQHCRYGQFIIIKLWLFSPYCSTLIESLQNKKHGSLELPWYRSQKRAKIAQFDIYICVDVFRYYEQEDGTYHIPLIDRPHPNTLPRQIPNLPSGSCCSKDG